MKSSALYAPSIPASTSVFTLIKTRPVSVSPDEKTLIPCSCRICGKSFALRNLLFSHLYEHGYCRPDKSIRKTSSSGNKSFKINNSGWYSGKIIQMDFGVLGDVISKFTAMAAVA